MTFCEPCASSELVSLYHLDLIRPVDVEHPSNRSIKLQHDAQLAGSGVKLGYHHSCVLNEPPDFLARLPTNISPPDNIQPAQQQASFHTRGPIRG